MPNRKKKEVLKYSNRKTVVFYEFLSLGDASSHFNGLWSLCIRMPQWWPLSPLEYPPFPWEHSSWGQLGEMPQKVPILWTIVLNSFLIWVEQLGLLFPVEVQFAAPLNPGRQGKFSFSRFYLGIKWQSRSMPSGITSPHPCWVGSPTQEKGKARREWCHLTELWVFSPSSPWFHYSDTTRFSNDNLTSKWQRDGQRG